MMTLREKFEDYHTQNPQVYELFKKFCYQLIERGFDHYSANAIFERIRWHVNVETTGDEFKMNNNYRAFYARMFMEEHPLYNDFFEIRQQRWEKKNEFNSIRDRTA
jgi:hypothetical protein